MKAIRSSYQQYHAHLQEFPSEPWQDLPITVTEQWSFVHHIPPREGDQTFDSRCQYVKPTAQESIAKEKEEEEDSDESHSVKSNK